MIFIIMGKDDAIQSKNALTHQMIGNGICRYTRGLPTAVHQKMGTVLSDQDTLTLSHIDNRNTKIIQLRFQPGQPDAYCQEDHDSCSSNSGVLLFCKEENSQKRIRQDEPQDDINTVGIDSCQRKFCHEAGYCQHIPDQPVHQPGNPLPQRQPYHCSSQGNHNAIEQERNDPKSQKIA